MAGDHYTNDGFRVVCSHCGRDIDAIGQDNVSYDHHPLCEDCGGVRSAGEEQICYHCEKCVDCYGSGNDERY